MATLPASTRCGWMPDFAAVAFLLMAAFKFVSGLETAIDPDMHDETAYLSRGLRIGQDGMPDSAYGPLYSLWYRALSRIEPDPLRLHDLNYQTMSVAPSVALYVAIRAFGAGPAGALGAAWWSLIWMANLPVTPKPIQFALVGALLAAAGAALVRRGSTAMFLAAATALILSYARPENSVVFALACLAGGSLSIAEWRQGRSPRAPWAWAAGIASAYVCLGLLFGSLFSDSSGRGKTAFGQHFALNWTRWTESPLDPWHNWAEISREAFGRTVGVCEAVLSEPALVAKHWADNAASAPRAAARLLFGHEIILFPAQGWEFWMAEAMLAACGLIVLAIMRRKAIAESLPFLLQKKRWGVLALALFAAPPAAAALAYYPRDHYLAAPCFDLLALAGAVLFFRRNGADSLLKTAALGAILLGLTPCYADRPGAPGHTRILPNRRIVSFLRLFDFPENSAFLAVEGGYAMYLGENIRKVHPNSKKENFDTFIKNNSIKIVIYSNVLNEWSNLKDDPQWSRFRERHREYGFWRWSPGKPDRDVFISEELSFR